VGAAGEVQGVLRVQAQWGAWEARAGLLGEVEAKPQAVVDEEASHSSVGEGAASPLEVQLGG
jgi:hypothetical protein